MHGFFILINAFDSIIWEILMHDDVQTVTLTNGSIGGSGCKILSLLQLASQLCIIISRLKQASHWSLQSEWKSPLLWHSNLTKVIPTPVAKLQHVDYSCV